MIHSGHELDVLYPICILTGWTSMGSTFYGKGGSNPGQVLDTPGWYVLQGCKKITPFCVQLLKIIISAS
jgi:hypothetical protein